VEWFELGNIADFYGGLTGKSKPDFGDGNAKYVPYKNILNNIDVNPNELDLVKVKAGERQNKIKYGDVLFTGSSETPGDVGMSSAVTTEFDEDVYLNSFSFGVRFKSTIKLLPEFAKYLFRSRLMRKEIAKTGSGVTRYNVSKERFKHLPIPIPCPSDPKRSLEIQAQIVRILDAFTELTAELTARKKQYNYYRDQLLTFEDGEVEWKRLGELGELVRGNGLQKKDFTETGVPAIHYGQLYTYYGLFTETTKSFVSPELAKQLRKVDKGDVVLTNTSEDYEGVCKALVYLGDRQAVTGGHATVFKPKPHFSGKYFAYFTQTEVFSREKRKHTKGTKVLDVSATDMAKLSVPIPCPSNPRKSLEIQSEIVATLDRFDALTNSISEGLPREIELRQKQYEYYRDMLLSFPKPECDNLS
jgi:type I restriction enzyme S subunit